MAVMERSEALERAHDYLSKTGGNNWKQGDELKRRSKNKNYMEIAHVIADIYQRGERPQDLDLQRIDFSVSTSNINTQVEDILTKRGAEQFDKEKEATRQSEMERAEKLIEEDRQQREEARRRVNEEMTEVMEGELFTARSNAWTAFTLSSLDTKGMFNPLVEMIEYAEAILEINEELDEPFDGHFKVLRERKKDMEQLIEDIEQVNEAAETDEAVEEDEDLTTDQVKGFIREKLESGEVKDQFEIIDKILEDIPSLTEDRILEVMDLMEAEAEVIFPDPNTIQMLDHDVVFRDLSDRINEEDQEILTEPFGEIKMNIIKPEESELSNAESPEDIREHIQDKIGNSSTEHVVAVYMEGDNDIIGTQTIAKGGFDSVQFDERQIVQAGIMMNAAAVVIAHNHPSGALKFTQQDEEASIDLERELKQFDIQLMDMILVTAEDHKSMKEEGRGAFV